MPMSDEEKFLFDLQGFIVIPNVLTPAECQMYIDLADQVWPRQEDDGPVRRYNGITDWGQPLLDLIDHPVVLEYLVELMGRPLRIDHEYCIFMREGGERNSLHGGPRLFESDHWYHYQDGNMRNGLTVATYNLTEAPQGAGGFACVPGSHKTNYLRNMPADVASFSRKVPWVIQPPMNAGDVLVFTEALIHGTQRWTAPHERRTLLYKFSPPHSSWRIGQYDTDRFPQISQRQKRLMAPPSVEAHPAVVPRGGSFER